VPPPVAFDDACWRNATNSRSAPIVPRDAQNDHDIPQRAHDTAASRRVALLLPVLFAASGCAALIYQVVWFQLLSLSIGASALSLGVLLPTFLGGLCVGSLLLPRFVAASAHPLRVLGTLELAIGALGLGALYAIPALGGVYTAWAGTGIGSVALRLVVAALALLPATILMGATLPAVAGSARLTRDGAARVGALYAANTGGAVVGAVLAGFYLLRVHDAHVATFVAVAIDVAVAATCFALAASAPPVAADADTRLTADRGVRLALALHRAAEPALESPPAPTPESSLARAGEPRWPILAASALSGATALCAEILWTRHLSLLFGGTVYAFALILAVFLFGLGVGSAAGTSIGRRARPRAALAWCQLALCAALAWAAYALARSLPFWPIDVTLPSIAAVELQLDLLRTAYAVLPAALLWGASFPLALAALAPAAGEPRRAVGALYAANTAGAIVGALATSFVLIVALGSARTQQLAILAAGAAALLLLATEAPRARAGNLARRPPQPTGRQPRLALLGAGSLAAALALAWSVPALPPALVAYGRFLPTRGRDANVVYVGEGLSSSIAVTREPSGILTYHNAGKTQASTYSQDLRLQRMLGHLATLVPERPRSVLVIGLGAGITAGAVSVDPAVERVVVAEIEPLVPKAAAQYFGDYNFGVVANPKIELRIDDGRHLLATTRATFDAITSDPLDPWVKGAAALYTREFWELCKARLNRGGVVTVFLQLYETNEDAAKSEVATFLSVFPNGALFANTVDGQGYDAVLLGRADEAPIDVDLIERRLAGADYERVARSLRHVGFDSALDLLGTYAGGARDMADWLGTAAINTDRNLRLQYLAADGLNVYRADEIYRRLVADGVRFPERLFAGSPAALEELRQRLRVRQGDY
jgi:spermidine synthase